MTENTKKKKPSELDIWAFIIISGLIEQKNKSKSKKSIVYTIQVNFNQTKIKYDKEFIQIPNGNYGVCSIYNDKLRR